MCVIYQGLCSDVDAVIQDSKTVGRVLLRILGSKLGRKTALFHFNDLATVTKIWILIWEWVLQILTSAISRNAKMRLNYYVNIWERFA
jgi:hypothetical protein